MTRALVLAAFACSACFPFGDALSKCEEAGHCPGTGGGSAAGGGAAGGGGGSAGGGSAGGSTCMGGGIAASGGGPSGPALIPGLGVVEPLCTDAGFCWQQPLPTGSTIRAVWVFSPNDWWLAGGRGALLHYDGTGLKVDAPAAEPDTTDWWGLWGTSTGDLLATGFGNNGLYLHHADGGWESLNVGSLDSPVITGNEDAGVVWILSQGALLKGTPEGSFQSVPLASSPGRAWGAAGATADSFYAALDPSPYLWSVTEPAGTPQFDGVSLATTNMLWSMTQHTNGALWVVGDSPDNGASDAFAAQQLADGGWLELNLNATSNSGRAIAQLSGGDDVLVATGEGYTYRATPGVPGVQVERQPVNNYDTGLNAVHSGAGIAVGAGIGVITLRDASGHWTTPVPADYRDLYTAVWKDGVMAVVGYGTLLLVRDAGSWPDVPVPAGEQGVNGVGVLHGALVVSGQSDVYRSNGAGGWTPFGCPPANFGALSVAGDDVWATTVDGGIFHAAVDAGCVPEVSTGEQLVAIAAADPYRVWAVGPHGAAWSRTDAGWTRSPAAGVEDLNDVVISPSGTYAVGALGNVYRFGNGPSIATGCSRAVEVVPTCTGDRIYVAGNANGGPPQLCIIDPGGQPQTLQVPSDQSVNALRSDGHTLYLFGASHTILTWPLP